MGRKLKITIWAVLLVGSAVMFIFTDILKIVWIPVGSVAIYFLAKTSGGLFSGYFEERED